MPIACWWPQVAFGEGTCRQRRLTGLHRDMGGKRAGVTNSRGFAKAEGGKKEKPKKPTQPLTFYLCFARSLLSFYF